MNMMKKNQYELKKDELVGRGCYRILRPIGHGGSGSVYLAVRLRDNAKAAVKATSRVSGMMEAEVMKRLLRPGCPGIPRLYDMEMRSSGRMLLIMEFIDGGDLRTLMNRLSDTKSAAEGRSCSAVNTHDKARTDTGRSLPSRRKEAEATHYTEITPNAPGWLDADEVLDWSLQICRILSYLHQQTPPVIYRDLKPSNLMLDKKGNIFLVDFGSARYFKGNLREDTERLGTRGYAAPEQFGSMGESDARTDIYGFGKVLLQLAERMQPEREERSEPPSQWRPAKRAGRTKFLKRPVFSYRPDVRLELEQLAQWCCLPERDERPTDVKTVLSELENLQDHYRKKREHSRRKRLVTAAAATMIIAVFTIALRSFTGWAQHATGMPSEEASAVETFDRTSRQETKQEIIAELNKAPADAQIYEQMLEEALTDDVMTEDELNRMEQCMYSVPRKDNSGGRTALEIFKWKNPSASDQFLYEYGTACFFCLEGGRPKGEALLSGIRDEKTFPQAQQNLLHAIHTLETGRGEEIWAALSVFTMNAADNASGEESEDVRPFYLESMYNEQISLIILSWAADASFELPQDEIDQFLENMDNYVKEGDSSDFSGKSASQSGRDSEDETKSEADNKKENGNQTMSTARRMLRTENEELLESVHSIRQSIRK